MGPKQGVSQRTLVQLRTLVRTWSVLCVLFRAAAATKPSNIVGFRVVDVVRICLRTCASVCAAPSGERAHPHGPCSLALGEPQLRRGHANSIPSRWSNRPYTSPAPPCLALLSVFVVPFRVLVGARQLVSGPKRQRQHDHYDRAEEPSSAHVSSFAVRMRTLSHHFSSDSIPICLQAIGGRSYKSQGDGWTMPRHGESVVIPDNLHRPAAALSLTCPAERGVLAGECSLTHGHAAGTGEPEGQPVLHHSPALMGSRMRRRWFLERPIVRAIARSGSPSAKRASATQNSHRWPVVMALRARYPACS